MPDKPEKQPQHLEADGFSYMQFPAVTEKAGFLIIILHGHGSDAKGMEHWAKDIQKEIPQADIILVDGPIAFKADPWMRDMYGIQDGAVSRTWIGIDHVTSWPGVVFEQVFNNVSAVSKLNHFIDARLAERKLGSKNLAIAGFSLGGAMAVQTATQRDEPPAAVISHSGTFLPFSRIKSKPDTLLIMGDKDGFYTPPPEKKRNFLTRQFDKVAERFSLQYDDVVKRLRKSGLDIETIVYPDMAHHSTPQSLAKIADFIKRKFK